MLADASRLELRTVHVAGRKDADTSLLQIQNRLQGETKISENASKRSLTYGDTLPFIAFPVRSIIGVVMQERE